MSHPDCTAVLSMSIVRRATCGAYMPAMQSIDWSAGLDSDKLVGDGARRAHDLKRTLGRPRDCRVARRWSVPNSPKKRPQDRARIDLRNGHEIRFWGRYFGCTTQQLIDCVNIVGFEVENVWRYLTRSAAGAEGEG